MAIPPYTRAVFLDRDGVINRDHGYVGHADRFELLPKVIPGLRLLQQAGFELIVVTNQSGIGRGYYTAADYEALNQHFLDLMASRGVRITGVLHCPHTPEDGCDCRKPRPGLILEAARRWQLDLGFSYLIGDKPGDIEAGRAAGLKACILVTGGAPTDSAVMADAETASLHTAAKWILLDA